MSRKVCNQPGCVLKASIDGLSKRIGLSHVRITEMLNNALKEANTDEDIRKSKLSNTTVALKKDYYSWRFYISIFKMINTDSIDMEFCVKLSSRPELTFKLCFYISSDDLVPGSILKDCLIRVMELLNVNDDKFRGLIKLYHCNKQGSHNLSTSKIAGRVSNSMSAYKKDAISWNKFLEFLRILTSTGVYILICLRFTAIPNEELTINVTFKENNHGKRSKPST